jgi:hypothetical protein
MIKMTNAEIGRVAHEGRVWGAHLGEQAEGIDVAKFKIYHKMPTPTLRQPGRHDILHHMMRLLHQITK